MTKAACATPPLWPIITPSPPTGTAYLKRPAPATPPQQRRENSPMTAEESMQAQTAKPLLYSLLPLLSLIRAFFFVVPTPSRLPTPPVTPSEKRISLMSHCDPIWPASTMSQMSHFPNFCDTILATNPCHTVTLSGQLAQCHRCHTFQLQKRVFSYNRCDIVTSLPRIAPNPTPHQAQPIRRLP